ncbi:MAG: hypothetical protein ACTHZ9_04695 [Leucobacter sp.]
MALSYDYPIIAECASDAIRWMGGLGAAFEGARMFLLLHAYRAGVY